MWYKERAGGEWGEKWGGRGKAGREWKGEGEEWDEKEDGQKGRRSGRKVGGGGGTREMTLGTRNI